MHGNSTSWTDDNSQVVEQIHVNIQCKLDHAVWARWWYGKQRHYIISCCWM